MKTVAIIQARMGSTRLPSKSLVEICGRPLLGHVIDRVGACQVVQELVVATTLDPTDDVLAAFVRAQGVPAYRGSPEDVLDRYSQAARLSGADVVVRITADDPFKDPDVIDLVAGTLLANPAVDYASNTLEPTYPEGLDVEVFRAAALERAWREAGLPSEREHVTPYLWKHPELFRLANVRQTPDRSALRWTLDYPEDLEFARAIYTRLYLGQAFGQREILALLDREPGLQAINAGRIRNAGYLQSLAKDSSTT